MFLLKYSIINIIRYKKYYILFWILLIFIAFAGASDLFYKNTYEQSVFSLENHADTIKNTDINKYIEMSAEISVLKINLDIINLINVIMTFIIIIIIIYTSIMSVLRHNKDIGVFRAMGLAKTKIILSLIVEFSVFIFSSIFIGTVLAFLLYDFTFSAINKEAILIIQKYDFQNILLLKELVKVFKIPAFVVIISSFIFSSYALLFSPMKTLQKN